MDSLEVFLASLDPGDDPDIETLAARAEAEGIPIIRRRTRAFLRLLLRMHLPKRILEVGTATGFSAIFMCRYSEASVVTIENYEKRIGPARENIREAGLSSRIELIFGDAARVLPELSGSFDFIFLDAAKGQYPALLPELLRLLAPGGVLAADNVLKGGEILLPRAAVERRNRTIHARMREFLYTLTHTPGLTADILPVGDGLAVAVRESEALEEAVR